MARRIWGKRRAGNSKQQMGRLQQAGALLSVLVAGVLTAALLGGSSYALTLVTGGTTETTRSLQAAGPSISSDKDDYNPGNTVTLTGHNWADAESVHVVVNDDAGQTWSYSTDATADAQGDFTVQFQPPMTFIASYAVTATGATSGTATTSFTDGNLTLHLATGQGVTTMTVPYQSFGKNNEDDTTCSGTGTTPGASPKTVTAGGTVSIGIQSFESIKLGAVTSAPAGFVFDRWTTGTSTTDSGNTVSGSPTPCIGGVSSGTNGNVTDLYAHFKPANHDPVIARNNASVSVNEGAAAANTGTWSDADAGDNVTLSASIGTVTKSGTNASGTWNWSYTPADGPASPTVTITADDGKGGTASTSFSLTVNNVAPAVTPAANQTATEGTSKSFNVGSFSDPGADSPWAVDVFWGDGTPHTTFTTTSTGALSTQDHTYADNGTYTVSVKVTDKDGGTDTKTFTITVANANPAVTAAADQSANEGASTTFSLGSFSDPGANDDPWSIDVNWGDGTAHSTFTAATQGALASQSHKYDDSGTYTVTVKATDKDGDAGTATFQVTVANVAPTASLANDGPVNEGSPVTVSFSGQSDPSNADAAAGFHYAYSCSNGDLSGATYGGSGAGASTTCTFPDNGTKTVKARIIDKDGGFTEYTTDVTVKNVAPSVSVSDQMAVEGTSGSFHLGSFSDPGTNDNPWKVHVDWGDGTGSDLPDFATQGSLGDADHTYADGLHDYTVTVKVTDKDGGSGTGSFKVTVVNAPPVVTAPANQNAVEGSSKSFDLGSFTDKGANDSPWSVDVNWGDGNSDSYSQNTQGTIAAESHTYDDGPHTYTVSVKVTDKDGGSDTKTFQATVANVAPTATLSNDGPTDEGSNATISFSGQHDASSADTGAGFHYTYACDGNAASLATTYASALMGASATCQFPDGPASHPVLARIYDKDGGYTQYSTTVVVNNVAPTVTAPADQNANEGTLTSFSLGSFSDPGLNDAPWTVYVQWGDGQSDSYSQGTQGGVAAESHTYVDNGTYTVSVNVQDKDGGNNTLTFKITVANLAPVVAGQFDQSSNEGQNASFDLGSFTDRGKADSPWKVHVDWGDGSSSDLADRTAQGALDNASHTYADNGSYTATVRVTDKDGDSGNGQFQVTVANLAPQVTGAADQNATEGTSTSFSLGSFSDLGANDGPWSADVNWGDGSAHTTFSSSSQGSLGSQSHTYADNGSYTVSVTVTDKDGGSGAATFPIVVANADPVVTAGSDQSWNEGASHDFDLGSFSDQGANDA